MKAKIEISGSHKYGAIYAVTYNDEERKGQTHYFYGLESLKKEFLNSFEGELELMEPSWYKEYSELKRLVENRKKENGKQI